MWTERFEYKEAAPHLLLYAYLQKVVNGGARVNRESALNSGRVDIRVDYGKNTYVIEVKVSCPRTASRVRKEGMEQIARYMDGCGAREGWLVIFDRDPDRTWDGKISWATESLPDGRTAHIVGC
jgi:hypothetical protein